MLVFQEILLFKKPRKPIPCTNHMFDYKPLQRILSFSLSLNHKQDIAKTNISLEKCLNRDIYQFIFKCINYKVHGIICIGLLKKTAFVFLDSLWADVD